MPHALRKPIFAVAAFSAIAGLAFLFSTARPGGASLGQIANSSLSPISSKIESLRPSREIVRRTFKLRPSFSVSLKNPEVSAEAEESQPLEEGSTFTLEADIETLRDLPSASYEWVTPKGVELIDGSPISGTLASLSPRHPQALKARFKNQSERNLKIYLRVRTNDGQERQIQTAQYNTQNQKEILVKRKQMNERQDAFLNDHPEALRKFR